MRGLWDLAGIRTRGLRCGKTEVVGASGNSFSKVACQRGRRCAAKYWNLEIIRVIHAWDVCLSVEQPTDLIVGIVVIRGQAIRWRRKIHGNGAAKRPGAQGSSGNILVRLPQNHLTRGTALARPGYDF